jgi:hypothetical protein
MDFAATDADDFVPPDAGAETFLDAIDRDPIATVRTTVRIVSLPLTSFIHLFTKFISFSSQDPCILLAPSIFL